MQPPDSENQALIKRYQGLVRELILLKTDHKREERLSKLASKVPPLVQAVIKAEVTRLTAFCELGANNSAFAKFPVMEFEHCGILMKLDEIGQKTLSIEAKNFDNQYSVAVYELVMDPAHYNVQIKKQIQQKITNVFTIPSRSFTDINFAEQLAIFPNFKIACSEFERGKECNITSLSRTGMVLDTKRIPAVKFEAENKKLLVFSFPHVIGLNSQPAKINFELVDTHFNKDRSMFETSFRFAANTPLHLINTWQQYIKANMNRLPLQRDLEVQRILQNLERDTIFNNSPWIPVFLGEKDSHLVPLYALKTPKNVEYNEHFCVVKDLPSKPIFQNLITELQAYKETFLLIGGIDAKDNHIQVVATHRQLAKLALVNQFIERLTRSTQLKVVQLRLQPVEATHKKLAFDVNNFTADESPSLNTISHILLCKDVTPLIGHLKVTHCEPFKPFPRAFINDKSDCWPIKVIMASASDRRNKVRYQMNIAAKISIGLFTQFDATLNDLSSSGLKLTLNNLTESTFDASPETVKISIKDINVVSQKYKIISYNPNTGILRLNLPKAEVRNKGQTIQGLVDSNAQYFDHRDLSIKQRNIHHFLWELTIRNLPSVCILVNFDRFSFNRLKTVYHQDNSIDLTPYTARNNTVSMQGFFVEDNATTAKSELLDKILCNNHRDVQVVHLVRNEEQHIIQVKESDFMFGHLRTQISEHLAKNTIDVCVSHISAIRCEDHGTPLTSKRLAQISGIDIDLEEHFKSVQKSYTHVIHLTNISNFHNMLLSFGIYPEAIPCEA
jgi:hypothetical protein